MDTPKCKSKPVKESVVSAKSKKPDVKDVEKKKRRRGTTCENCRRRRVTIKPLQAKELTPHVVIRNVLNYFTEMINAGGNKHMSKVMKEFFDSKTPHQLTAQACGIKRTSMAKYLKPDSEKKLKPNKTVKQDDSCSSNDKTVALVPEANDLVIDVDSMRVYENTQSELTTTEVPQFTMVSNS